MFKVLVTGLAGLALTAGAFTAAQAYPAGVQPVQYRGGGDRCYAGERIGDCRERLRWERRHGNRYEWRDGRYHGRNDNNDAGAAMAGAILGFALGAAIQGNQGDYDYYNNHRDDRGWRSRCQARYRSFDWRTGTYVTSSGYRRYCRL